MNQLTDLNIGYPYLFFPVETFYKEQVTNYIVDLYMQMAETYDNNMLSVADMSSVGIELYKVGVIARICALDEENDSFMFTGLSGYVKELHKENQDFFQIADELSMFPMDPEKQKLFQHDIAKALEIKNICFLKSDTPYELMRYRGIANTEENVVRYFKNLPNVKVW